MQLPAIALLLFAMPLQAATVSDWPLPAPEGSAQPNLSLAPDGDLVLSWIERRDGGGHRLAYGRFNKQGDWQPTRIAAQGAVLVFIALVVVYGWTMNRFERQDAERLAAPAPVSEAESRRSDGALPRG